MTLLADGLLVAAAALVVLGLGAGHRLFRGPTVQDRVIAANAMGTTTVVVIALLGAALGEPGYLDVALVYALLNFLLSVGLAKYVVERGGVLQ
ncbi:cation:proton antiporter [Haloglomus litoreum]|uniref:cation:proton antiporter n=1 Tax=Haloglomus litoreum TaxID=3034026 RepID=UPI0023E8D3BD|nr:cation:proton antiporter [Haloglomus sp. DT116]